MDSRAGIGAAESGSKGEEVSGQRGKDEWHARSRLLMHIRAGSPGDIREAHCHTPIAPPQDSLKVYCHVPFQPFMAVTVVSHTNLVYTQESLSGSGLGRHTHSFTAMADPKAPTWATSTQAIVVTELKTVRLATKHLCCKCGLTEEEAGSDARCRAVVEARA